MTLRLRCIRCGDLDDMDPMLGLGWGLCHACRDQQPPLVRKPHECEPRTFFRWTERWQKGMERHPTFLALSAALDAMESTPPGTLDDLPGTLGSGTYDPADDKAGVR